MKEFKTYQYLKGDPMTHRDKTEVGSKFWNEGKWDNFVAPFLPEDCSGLTFVDMGCNSGLFLKLAKDRGFECAVGVDNNMEAVVRGRSWAERNGYNYEIFNVALESSLDVLPLADFTVLANSHYYIHIEDFIKYLDRLRSKSIYCVVVTDEKRHVNKCWASADVDDIRRYFSDWDEVGFIDLISPEGDPRPRKLRSLCFRSRYLKRAPAESLDCGNHVQDNFYAELDEGKHYKRTRYYRIMKPYRLRKHGWTQEQLDQWFDYRVEFYKQVKTFGMREPIMFSKGVIVDGNHRHAIMKHLGYKEVFVREV